MGDRKEAPEASSPVDDVTAFNAAALKAVAMACKLSNALPSENKADHDYYSSFSAFRSVMESCTSRYLPCFFS